MSGVSQSAFRAALLDGARRVPEGIVGADGAPCPKRFAVYRNNVAASLGAALETGFPAVRRLIGETNFKAVAGAYLRAHPPESPLMARYGAGFAEHLEGIPPLAHMPFLADVARLEMALRESYHAADAAPIPPERMAEMTETTRLTFAPGLRLIPSRFPLVDLWEIGTAHRTGQPRPVAQWALITRPEFDPIVTALEPATGTLLAALIDGAPLGAAMEHAGDNIDLTSLFTALASGRAITALSET